MSQVFRVTFPNGKIFIGYDMIGQICYFGGFDSARIQEELKPFKYSKVSLQKELLWESETATEDEVLKTNERYVSIFRSNDPDIGYN